MNWDVYAYWNTVELTTVFNAVAALVGGSDFNGLVRSIALVVLIALALSILAGRAKTEDFGRWFIMLAMFNGMLLVPKVSVVIHDRTGSAPSTTVANVPLGLAALASSTSHIGDWLTATEEALFGLPSDVELRKNGTLFGHRVMRERLNASVLKPELANDLNEFYRECVWPDVATGYLSTTDIVNSQDIWADLSGNLNPGVYVLLSQTGTTLSCPSAYTTLTNYLATDVDNNLQELGKKLYPDLSATLAKSALVGSLQSTSNYMLGTAASSQNVMRQAIISNSIIDASYEIPAQVGDGSQAAVKLAQIQGLRAFNTSNEAMVALSEQTMPKLRNVVEILIYALFPLAAILIVTAGHNGLQILKFYLGTLLWVQLWAPLYAILNFVMNVKAASGMSAMTAGDGLALKYYSYLGSAVANDQAVAGVLTLAIPMIAYGIVQGTMSVASSLAGAASRAGTYGDSIAQGNIAVGASNVDAVKSNMYSSGQYSSQPTMRTGLASSTHAGAEGTVANQGGMLTMSGAWGQASGIDKNRDGRLSYDEVMSFQSAGTSIAGSGAALGTSDYRGTGSYSGNERSAGKGRQDSSGMAEAARLSQSQAAEFSRTLGESIRTEKAVDSSRDISKGASDTLSNKTGVAGGQELLNTEGVSIGSGLTAGGSAQRSAKEGESASKMTQAEPPEKGKTSKVGELAETVGGALSARIGGDAKTAQQYTDRASKMMESMSQQQISEAFGLVKRSLDKTAEGTSDEAVKKASQSVSSALDKTTTYDSKTVGSLMDTATAGVRNEKGTRNDASVRVDNSMDLFREAWGMLAKQQGWDSTFTNERANVFANEWNNNAAFREEAMMKVADRQRDSSTLERNVGEVAKPSDLAMPTVRNEVSKAHAGNQTVVGNHQPVSPTSAPLTPESFTKDYKDIQGRVDGGIGAAQGQQVLSQGVAAVSNQLYNERQSGAGQLLSNSFFGGMGTATPDQYSKALNEAAKHDPELAGKLSSIGQNAARGIAPSSQDMQWIDDRASKAITGAEKGIGEVFGLKKE